MNTAVTALDVAGRIAYTVSQPPMQPTSPPAPLSIRAWHLDTLKPLTPVFKTVPVGLVDTRVPIAVDERNHTLMLVPNARAGTTPTAYVFAIRSGQIAQVGALATRFTPGSQVAGLTVDSAHDRVLVLAAPYAGARTVADPAVGGLQVDAWRLGDASSGKLTAELTTPAPVPNTCAQTVTTQFPAALAPTGDGRAVFFGCVGNRVTLVSSLGPTMGEIGGVARLELFPAAGSTTPSFRLYPVGGNFSDGDTLSSPGGDRLLISSKDSIRTNVKVFDTTRDHWVGNVGIDGLGLYGFAADARTGRGYSLLTGGMGVFELGPAPVTQGRILDKFNEVIGSGKRLITFDPKTRRLFVPTSDNVVNGGTAYMLVMRDTAPPYDLDKAVDPDAGALDIAEQAGLTDSNRTADAAATGAEIRLVGGTGNLLLNIARVQTPGVVSQPGTRDYEFGVTRHVRLTNDTAEAEAITYRQDATTTGTTTNSPPAAPVQCVDFSGTKAQQSADSVSATCDLAGQHVSATVTASVPRVVLTNDKTGATVPEPIQVRSASSSVVTERLASGVTKTTVTAEADGVDLFGVVQIGRVVSTAVTETHGRRGTAKTTYTRTFTDVTAAGNAVCHLACSLDLVRDRVNDALTGRAYVTIPDPGITQSPGGVAAEATVDKYQHVEDMLINEESADNVVSAAMIVVGYADATTTSRLVARFAAVSAKQSYRIYRLSADSGDDGSVPVVDPRPVTGVTIPGTPGRPGETVTIPGGKGTASGGTQGGDTGGGLFGGLIQGLRVVFRSPGQIAGVACLWMLLALPAYLAARRRLLLELPRLRRVQEDV
jgi:hypothetical protein